MPCWPDKSSSFLSQVSGLRRKSQVVLTKKGSPHCPAPQRCKVFPPCPRNSSVLRCESIHGALRRSAEGEGGRDRAGGGSPMSCSLYEDRPGVDAGRIWGIEQCWKYADPLIGTRPAFKIGALKWAIISKMQGTAGSAVTPFTLTFYLNHLKLYP